MQVWITRHCLTERGIYAVEGKPEPGIYRWFRAANGETYRRTEWYFTEHGAVERQKELLRAQIASLEKRLERCKRDWRRRFS